MSARRERNLLLNPCTEPESLSHGSLNSSHLGSELISGDGKEDGELCSSGVEATFSMEVALHGIGSQTD